MSSLTTDEKLQLILDRIAIEDCLKRYSHAVDRCDRELLRTVYWPDAVDDHVFWKGEAPEFVEFSIGVLETRDQSMHAISNIMIRLDGRTARVQCYYDAYERVRRKDGTSNDVTFIGRYLDRFEKRGDEWRIAERKVVIDSWRIWPDSADWPRGVFGHKVEVGKRGAEDPSAALFGDRLLHEPISNKAFSKWELEVS
jgi:hypothetical protein